MAANHSDKHRLYTNMQTDIDLISIACAGVLRRAIDLMDINV